VWWGLLRLLLLLMRLHVGWRRAAALASVLLLHAQVRVRFICFPLFRVVGRGIGVGTSCACVNWGGARHSVVMQRAVLEQLGFYTRICRRVWLGDCWASVGAFTRASCVWAGSRLLLRLECCCCTHRWRGGGLGLSCCCCSQGGGVLLSARG
jgi:hypothetical protein